MLSPQNINLNYLNVLENKILKAANGMERPLNDKSEAKTFLVVATLLCTVPQAGNVLAVIRAKTTALCFLSE